MQANQKCQKQAKDNHVAAKSSPSWPTANDALDNGAMSSALWKNFEFKPGDVVVGSYLKAGKCVSDKVTFFSFVAKCVGS